MLTLDALPELIVLEVFKRLSHEDLLSVLYLGGRYARIAKDTSLWQTVRLVRRPVNHHELKRISNCLGPHTTHLAIKGHADISKSPKDALRESFVNTLSLKSRSSLVRKIFTVKFEFLWAQILGPFFLHIVYFLNPNLKLRLAKPNF